MSLYLFISDLHLDSSRPRATQAFLKFLSTRAQQADRLYILGDLFEFWIGDDEDTPLAREVRDALSDYANSGRYCGLMRGNRDFLLGSAFARSTRAQLLPDPTIEEIHGERVLLMHGDLLCTDDHAYQRYRGIVNQPALQRLFLALPRSLRRAAGDRGRARSRRYQAGQPPAIMDVNAAAVDAALARHDASTLIHGHTHRPGIHRLGDSRRPTTRLVLGDWYQQGSVLEWDERGYRLQSFSFG